MTIESLIIGSVDEQVVLREWLRPQPAVYATAGDCPAGPGGDASRPQIDPWTAVTSVDSAHVDSWTGDMPLRPDGSESDHLAQAVKIVAGTLARSAKR